MEQVVVGSRSSVVGYRVGAVVLGAVLVAVAAQISVPLPGTPVPMTLQPMAVLLVGGLLGARFGALSLILYLAMGAAGLPVFTPTVPLFGIARLLGPTGGYLLAYPIAAYAVGWFSDPARKRGVQEPQVSGLSDPARKRGVQEPQGSGLSDPARKRGENPSGAWVPNHKQEVGRGSVNPGLAPGVRTPWVQTGVGAFTGLVLIHLGGLAQLAIITGSIAGAAQLATWPFLLGDLLKIAVLVPVLTQLTPTIRARL